MLKKIKPWHVVGAVALLAIGVLAYANGVSEKNEDASPAFS